MAKKRHLLIFWTCNRVWPVLKKKERLKHLERLVLVLHLDFVYKSDDSSGLDLDNDSDGDTTEQVPKPKKGYSAIYNG